MKFMFMIYHDENVLDALPKSEMQGLIDSALGFPPARVGIIEVRPVRELTHS